MTKVPVVVGEQENQVVRMMMRMAVTVAMANISEIDSEMKMLLMTAG
jgi:hypothetical protein